MTESSANAAPDRASLRKRLTIAGLALPFLVLLMAWNLTSQREPGGASHSWRIVAVVAWFLVGLGYPLVSVLVRYLPEVETFNPRAVLQFVGAIAWWSLTWFCLGISGGNNVWHATLKSPVFALVVVGIFKFLAVRRAALAAQRPTA